MRRAWMLYLLPGLLLGCASTAIVPTEEQATPAMPSSVRWVADSAEYRAILAQTYRAATGELETLVRDLEPGTWAVALDADETVISNIGYSLWLLETGRASSREEWAAWTRKKESPPLPGVLSFLGRVRELGGKIAIVTNRIEDHCPDTRENFRKYDIPFDVILCRSPGNREKEPRWEMVHAGTASPNLPPLQIVMWFGDNIGDFPNLDQSLRSAGEEALADFGVRYFALPNPVYGSWEPDDF